MTNIETAEYKALRLKFDELRAEQEQIQRDGFAKVFEVLDGLEKAFTPQHPYTENEDNLNKALEITGHSVDEAFCKAFKRNNQIMIEGKAIEFNGLIQIAKELYEQTEEPKSEQKEWRFYPTSIMASPELHPIINEIITNDAENGTGLFSNKTDIPYSDESFDEYFDCEAYGIQYSFQSYIIELEQYGVTKTLFTSNELSLKVALQVMKNIVDFIKINSESPNKVRNYIAKLVKGFDSIPVWGLFYQILILQGLCEWCGGVSAKIEGRNGCNDVKALWLWIEKQLIDKEMAFIYTPYGEADKVRLKPLCDYLYNTELGHTIQEKIFNKEKPQLDATLQEQLSNVVLPEELNTSEALKWLKKAIDCGLLDESFQPTAKVNSKGKKAALAVLLNELIGLMTIKGNDRKEFYSWKPFETLWQVTNMGICATPITNPNKDKPKYYNTYKSLLNR